MQNKIQDFAKILLKFCELSRNYFNIYFLKALKKFVSILLQKLLKALKKHTFLKKAYKSIF